MADRLGLKEIVKAVKSSKAVRPVDGATKKPLIEQIPEESVPPMIAAPEVAPSVAPPPVVAKPLSETLQTPREPLPTPEKLAGAKLDDYDTADTHQFNFATLHTTDDVKALVAEIAETQKGRIEESRRGKVTDDEVLKLAADLNSDGRAVRAMLERETGQAVNAETIVATRQVLHSSANELKKLAVSITNGQNDDLTKIKFRRHLLFHADLQTAFMGARAEAGRALRAFNIPDNLGGDELRMLAQTVENLNGRDTTELAKVIAETDSISGLNTLAKRYSKSKIEGVLQELYISAILSGVKTHVINGMGISMQYMRAAEYGVAAQVGRMFSTEEAVQRGEATALLVGQVTGFMDALKLAGKAFRKGESLDSYMRFQGHTRKAISAENLEITNPSLGAAVNLIGSSVRVMLDRVMAPMDEFQKAVAWRSELSRLATRETSMRLRDGTLQPQEAELFLKNYMDNPPSEVLKLAGKNALDATFQSPLGERGRNAQKFVNSIPGGWLFAPFIPTPVNVFKQGIVKRSPLGLFSAEMRREIAAGGARRDLAIARMSMGAMTMAMTYMATNAGNMTGMGPQEPNARKLWLMTHQPYSFKIGYDLNGNPLWQSYSRMEPFAFVIGSAADAAEIGAWLDFEDPTDDSVDEYRRLVESVSAGVINNTVSKTFLDGLVDMGEIISDTGRYLGRKGDDTAAATIPWSAFRRQMAQQLDPYVREAFTLSERIAVGSGIPGYSEQAPFRRDLLGDPILGSSGSLLGAFSPFPDTLNKPSPSPIAVEAVRLMDSTHRVPLTMPKKEIQGVRLGSREYSDFVELSRKTSVLDGMTFQEKMTAVMDSSLYQMATDDARVDLLKQQVTRYNAQAAKDLLDANADLAYRVEVLKMLQNDKRGKL